MAGDAPIQAKVDDSSGGDELSKWVSELHLQRADREREHGRSVRRERMQYLVAALGAVLSLSSLSFQLVGLINDKVSASGTSILGLAIGFLLIISALTVSRDRSSFLVKPSDYSLAMRLGDDSETRTQIAEPADAREIEVAAIPLMRLQSRIDQHVTRLQKFAFANIAVGSIIASAGVAVIFLLFGGILGDNFNSSDFDRLNYMAFFVVVLLPRLSIVILIQVFAYFFLSMYRANLREIRYFQIELNDLDLLAEALTIASAQTPEKQDRQTIGLLFEMVKYRGDTFRAAVANDEALRTFEALSLHGNVIDKVTPLFRKQPETSRRTARITKTKKAPENDGT